MIQASLGTSSGITAGDPPVVVLADSLVDGTGAPPLRDPAVTIVGGRIVAVEARGEGWTAPSGATIVDEPGTTLMPGMIDTHVHLCFTESPPVGTLLADDVALDDATEAALLVRGYVDLQRALVGGLTTMRDVAGPGRTTLILRDTVRSGIAAGPRLLVSGPALTTTGGHLHWMSLRADTPYELVARVRQLADLGVDWVKVMESGGMSSPGTDPYQPQYPLAALGPAVAEAHRLGLRVAAHALCAAAVRVAIRAGIDTLEHGWTISGDRQDFEPEIAVELAASRIPGSVTAHDTLRNLLPEGDRAGDLATIRSRLIPHRALAAAGVPILVHSDAAFGRAHFDEFAKSVEVFQVGMNVTPVEAIRAATGIPARALGLDDHIGTVRVGLYADLLLVGGDAATDIRALRAVRRVILGGETVVINGRLVLPTASDEPLSTVM